MAANGRAGIQRAKDQEMAAALKARGIYHGMHQTKTNAPPVPNMKDTGSAAYRRLVKKREQ